MKTLCKTFLFAALGVATVSMTSNETEAAIKILSHPDDAYLYDADGDDIGNETFGKTSDSHYAGEYMADTGEIRAWIPFALTTEQRAAIAAAESVTFGIYVSGPTNPIGQTDFRGFSDKNSTTASAGASEFHETTELLKSAFTTPTTPVGFLTQDITAFAKAQALNNSVVAFRIEVSGADTPNNDTVINRFRFAASEEPGETYDPYIEITAPVPEPAGMALLGLAGTLALRRRSRKS